MKQESWLKPNRRALGFALVPPFLLAVAGGLLVEFVPRGGWTELFYWGGWAIIGLAAVIAAALLKMLATPRLGYQNGELLVYLRGFVPHRVPIEVVEVFFLGQGPSYMPSHGEKPAETSTIVVRLAEAAHEWNHIDVKPSLGHWCDSYITIRGTWCEPINAALMKRLNERLVAVHRERRAAAAATSAATTKSKERA